MIELLDYGTATQEYFGLEGTANAVVTPEIRAMYGKDLDDSMKATEGTNKKVNGAQNDLVWVGASVSFSDAFKINFYGAKGQNFEVGQFGMIYWTAEQYAEAGETLDPAKATELQVFTSTSGYKATIDKISARNGDDVFYVAMYQVEADGTVSYSTVKACSVQMYATLASARTDKPTTAKLGEAILVYLAAAKDYLG